MPLRDLHGSPIGIVPGGLGNSRQSGRTDVPRRPESEWVNLANEASFVPTTDPVGTARADNLT